MAFDWHLGSITRSTPIDKNYRNTQNVRRFLIAECGEAFRFNRELIAWIKEGGASTIGEVADQWVRMRS